MNIHDRSSLLLVPSGYKDGKLYSQVPNSGDGDFTFTRGSNLSATRVGADGLIEKGRENLLLQSNQFDTTWTQSGSSGIITSGFTGYDGSNDAWQLEHKGSQYTSLRQTLSSSGVQTYSLYAKAGTLDYVIVYAQSSVSPKAWFNLSNGTIGSQQGSTIDASIESVGNGWYRCSIVFNDTLAGVRIYPNDGDGTYGTTSGTIYIQDAQLEAGLAATDYIESGATTGKAGILENQPRLDYSGGASRASLLLEPQRTNQVNYSEYFGASYWSKTNSAIINNAVLSPEGLQNATELFDNATSGAHFVYKSAISASSNHIISFFAKANTLSQVFVNGGASLYAYVDLINGVKLSGTADTTIEDYGNGWWRISIISDRDGVLIATSKNTNNNYSGSGESIYIYGVQSEEAASYPTSYIPTYGSSVTRNRDTGSLDMITAGVTTGWTSATLFIEYEKPNTGEGVDTFRMHGTSTNGRAYIYNTGVGFAADWAISGGHTLNATTKHIWRLDSLSEGTRFRNGAKENSGSGTAWSDIRYMYLNNQGLGGTLKIKQIALFPTALSDIDCELLTGTTYESFAAMAEALNYTVYE